MSGELILNIVQTLLIAGVFAALPLMWRRDLFFAWTVGPDFRKTEAGRRILRRYLLRVTVAGVAGVGAAVALGLGVAGASQGGPLSGVMAAMVLLNLASYMAARRAARPHARMRPDGRREVALSGGDRLRDFLPRPWYLIAIPYLVVGGTAVWLALHMSALPARVPAPFHGASGADRYVPRGSLLLFLPLAQAGGILLLLNLLMFIAPRVRRLRGTLRRARLTNLILLEAMTLVSLAQGLLVVLPVLVPADRRHQAQFLAAAVIMACYVTAVALTLGLGLRRARHGAETHGEIGDRTPDECWKLGLFYVNRTDPALWVEERFGIGYTLNLAHRAAVPLVLAFVAAFVAVAVIPPLVS